MRDFSGQSGLVAPQVANTIFREPVHQLLEKVRKEPYFKWPSKMARDPTKRNQNLGDVRITQGRNSGSNSQRNNSSWPLLGMINVILVAPGRTGSYPTRVMSVSHILAEESDSKPKKFKGASQPILGFSDEDKVGTIQPHDDTLVVTLRIGNYDVSKVMVDQGSGADIIYPDLFKGLNLKLEDLTAYDSPLISFERKAVIPKR
ncbi:uncharacterized protein LOC142620599 [Castanea sativa]|uniref:uncharacterized protein LOC142620599 n=1 Tax=Castanea sativa TaxID=21020 RepID=UPI003F64F847